ncbi:hypothetical protein BKI52_06235 [marine bacterium AO1-C]|nr:hypothetical protein BKI52_06235 [marine bacterium AO1-C]
MKNTFTHYQCFTLLLISIIFLTNKGLAQGLTREGNPKDKSTYEFNRLKNPYTGKIPENIREKELTYVLTNPTFKKKSKNKNGHQVIESFDWNQRGPFNVGGRTRAIAIDLNDENIILAGGVSGGMWRSTDAGASWTKTTGSSQNHSVTDVYQDPNNRNIWYYVTGEFVGNSASASGSAPFRGVGIYRSTDSGLTWVLLPITAVDPTPFISGLQYNYRVRVNPTNSDVLVAAFNGIFRSSNQGGTFTRVLDGDGSAIYTDIEVSATGVMYATSGSNGNSKGVWKSTDNGDNWSDVTPPTLAASYQRIVLDIAPSNENIVYVFAHTPGSGTNDHQLFYTDNAATSWTERTSNLPAFGGFVGDLGQGSYNQYIKVKPDDPNTVFIGSLNIYRSTDGYATTSNTAWIGGYSPANNVSRYENHHPDNHSLVFYPSDAKKMLTGHDGGISLTLDNTATNAGTFPVAWTELNNGYNTTQAYGLAIDQGTANDARLFAGFQDNGKWMASSTSATTNWDEEFGGGDGTYVALITGQTIRYSGTQNGRIRRYSGPIASPTGFSFIHPASATGQQFVNPFILDKNDQEIMYYPSGSYIWRHNSISTINNTTTSAGDDTGWSQLLNSNTSSSSITTVDVSKNNAANVLYYGTSNGKVFRLDNANTGDPTAVDIFTGKGLPSAFVSCVAVDPNNSANVIVTFSNYEVISVYYSTDSGNNWTNISGNLEQNADGSGNGPSVRWAEIHRDSDGGVVYLIGASTGLYSTQTLNGTSTVWGQEGTTTIGNVPVVMIEGRSVDNLVAVGTHGVGLFSGTVAASVCGVPTNLTATNIRSTTLTLNWDAVGGANTYDVRYRIKGTTSWTEITGFASNSANITGLTKGSTYEFEARALCGSGTGSYSALATFSTCQALPYSESFEGFTSDWTQDATDNIDWAFLTGATASSNTGPSSADQGSDYIYTEATGNFNSTARLISPCFDLTDNVSPRIKFSYHMFGSTMGTLALEVSTDNGSNWVQLWTENSGANLGDVWNNQNINLSAYAGNTILLRFVGVTGGNFESDIALDNIIVYDANPSAEKGNFLDLDGTTKYLSTNTPILTITDNFTIEFWFQRSSSGSGDRMLFYNGTSASSNGYGLLLNSSNYVVPTIGGTAITNTTTLISADQWYHAALVRESGTLRLFINGIAQTLGSSSAPATPTTASYFGANASGANIFTGRIEELKCWTVARTEAQVREFMHLTLDGTETGIAAYYQFNESIATDDVTDVIGANQGKPQNSPTRTGSDCPIGKGRSQTINVTTGGVKDFNTTGLQLEFPGSGTYPNGDLVVTQIDGTGAPTNVPSDVQTHPSAYWVIHNYGSNATFTAALTQVTMTLPTGDVISAADEADPSNIRIYKRSSNAGNAENWTNLGSAASATASTRTLVFSSFTPTFDSFSQVMAGTVNTATSGLPVTLSRFEAIRQTESQVSLTWETISEINSLKFEIEKSNNGVDFTNIGVRDAAGNSKQTLQYSFIDANALRSAYYRLKQIDRDGTFQYSSIRFVEGKDLQSIRFFPNPFSNELKISFGSNLTPILPIRLEVYSTKGQRLVEVQGEASLIPQFLARKTQALPKGVYVVKMFIGNKLYTKQVIKQ